MNWLQPLQNIGDVVGSVSNALKIPGVDINRAISEGTSASSGSSGSSGSLPSNNSSSSASESLTPGANDDILSYLGGLFSSVGENAALDRSYNSAQAEINRQFQAHEAEKQRRWYEEMSATSYQRAMSDLRKAGLNPILAYSQGGAATSGTAVPSGSAASHSTSGGDTLTSVLGVLVSLASLFNGGSALKTLLNSFK